MNMTVVIVTRQSQAMEFLMVLVCALALVAPLANLARAAEGDKLQAVKDESRELDDDQLGSIVREFGGQLEDDMESEMDKLARELEHKAAQQAAGQHRGKRLSSSLTEEEIARLREVNKATSQDIRARIEMAGDNAGSLPQWSLGDKASSFLSATSQRLSAASSYVGNKLRNMGSSFGDRVPAKLRRFFKWPTFLAFKVRHHKVYKSVREELYRQMLFLRTHVKVGMQHLRFLLRRDRHLLGANQFADQTPEEIYKAVNNAELASEAQAVERGGPSASEHQQIMGNLERLASKKRNIFGQEVRGAGPGANRRRRRRRSVSDSDLMDASDDELSASEDELDAEEEDDELAKLGSDLTSESGDDEADDYDDDDDEDSYKLVEEFANADLSSLDEIERNLDEALEGKQEGGDSAKPFEAIDLRQTGCIIKPENQNNCGMCYAQATTAAATYYNCMANGGELERLHAKFTSDCGQYITPEGKPKWINGCAGGRMMDAVAFQKTVGLPRFGDYNFAMVSARVMDNGKCAYPRPEGPLTEHNWPIKLRIIEHYRNSRYTRLASLDEVDLHLRTVGPVLVNIRTWPDFMHYEAGVYDKLEEADRPGLHSMMIVGHERDAQGRDIYIIWNSHGIVWGERGYALISAEALAYYQILFVGMPPNTVEV